MCMTGALSKVFGWLELCNFINPRCDYRFIDSYAQVGRCFAAMKIFTDLSFLQLNAFQWPQKKKTISNEVAHFHGVHLARKLKGSGWKALTFSCTGPCGKILAVDTVKRLDLTCTKLMQLGLDGLDKETNSFLATRSLLFEPIKIKIYSLQILSKSS